MNRYVVDTHAIYWHLTQSSKLGPRAAAAFEEGERDEARLYVPSIVLCELFYLNEKLKRPLKFADVFNDLDGGRQYVLVPFEPSDVLRFDTDYVVPEMHDRMIVGVAMKLNAPIITMDARIASSGHAAVVW